MDAPQTVRWLLVVYGVLIAFAVYLWAGVVPAHADQQSDPKPISWKDCVAGGGSTIAVGGTAQNSPLTGQPLPSLRGFFLQNPSTATESLFFDTAKAASVTNSPELAAGASVSYGPGTIFAGTMSVNAATGGHAFKCQYAQ